VGRQVVYRLPGHHRHSRLHFEEGQEAVRRIHLRTLGSVAFVAALAMTAAACQKSGSSGGGGTAAKCGGKIAIFGAFSGGNAGLVLPSRDGARLAVKNFNKANPNCKVEMQEFDTEGDPAKATPVASQIAADASFLGVIGGHFSGESRATAPTFESAGIAMVAPSATAVDLTTKGWKVFHRVVGNDGAQGPALGRYIKSVLKAQKVVVVDDGSAYGAALADQVAGVVGSAVVARDKVQEKQTNFAATVSKVKAANADAVFYGGYTNEASPFLKQLRGAGITAKFLGGDGINDEAFPQGAGTSESEGAIIGCPCIPFDKGKGTFPQDWKAEYNKDPGVYSAEGWDSANIFLDAFKAGKTTRKDILDFVNAYDKDGATKHIKFDSKGDVDASVVVIWAFVVKGGKITADQEIPKS
jgi:branched-chain amino acid transport system substrate-binding protein